MGLMQEIKGFGVARFYHDTVDIPHNWHHYPVLKSPGNTSVFVFLASSEFKLLVKDSRIQSQKSSLPIFECVWIQGFCLGSKVSKECILTLCLAI